MLNRLILPSGWVSRTRRRSANHFDGLPRSEHLNRSEAIGNVIAQSSAFWRGIGHTARYWGNPARDEGREGFARLVASRPAPSATVRVRFYLTIGRLEDSVAFNDGMISMLHASRHVRDVLQARGYDVTLRETSGGHDPYNWEAALPDALIALLSVGPPTTIPKR